MKLADTDIRTREVLTWDGLHLFHAHSSSCSQKVRIALNLKGAAWTSHLVDFGAKENISAYYLGINPRGLVPVLVHDGAVHIESNDILTYLEDIQPEPALIPREHRDAVARLLRHEDDLHLALRTISFRFLFAPEKPPKSADDLGQYAKFSSGTVGGVKDDHIDQEIAYWQAVLDGGISDDAARAAVAEFRTALADLETRLADQPYLLGDDLSVLDIAWIVYVNRLTLAGYPVARVHPGLARWSSGLKDHPAFRDELALPKPLAAMIAIRQAALAAEGRDFATICPIV